MKKIWGSALTLLVLAFASSSAFAETTKGVLGIGLVVGEPTGVSAKYYLADDHAVDAAVGFSVLYDGIQAHADYLWHPWILEEKRDFVLPAYVGIGVRILDESDKEFHLGPRGVVGMVFDFKNIALDAFAEFAGVLDFRFGDDDGMGIDLKFWCWGSVLFLGPETQVEIKIGGNKNHCVDAVEDATVSGEQCSGVFDVVRAFD